MAVPLNTVPGQRTSEAVKVRVLPLIVPCALIASVTTVTEHEDCETTACPVSEPPQEFP